MKNKNLIITVLVMIVVAGGSFFAGMKFQQRKLQTFTLGERGNVVFNGQGKMQQGQRQGGSGVINRGAGFRPVLGEIISSDDKSITVKMQDGSSKIIIVGDSTQINKADTAAKSDLTTGQTVSVFGQENSDGTITAQNIQLNPQMNGQINPQAVDQKATIPVKKD